MSDTQAQIAELLHEAGETHHQVYRITDGVDADWASIRCERDPRA